MTKDSPPRPPMVCPLRLGEPIAGGWELVRIRQLRDRWSFYLAFPELEVIVEPLQPDKVYVARTAHLGLWIPNDEGNERLRRLVGELAKRLGDDFRLHAVESPGLAHAARSRVYLVPGHLGAPTDLSVRAIQILSSVPLVLIEQGKEAAVARILSLFGIDGPAIEVMSRARLERAIAAGQDVCLFGADEGIPGFCDPGKIFDGLEDRAEVVTVGGPSVLGAALMRLPVKITDYLFAGLLHRPADAARLQMYLTPAPRVPMLLFSSGRAVREHLPPALAGLDGHSVHLLASLTRPEERCFSLPFPGFAAPSDLDDHANVVVAILFRPPERTTNA